MKLMTVSEVASILQVRKETVYEWIKDGELDAIRLDRLIRVDESDLADFIKRHKERRHR